MNTYYLHLLTTVTKPNLHACVVQMLPKDAIADSFELESRSAQNAVKSVAAGKGKSLNECVSELLC